MNLPRYIMNSLSSLVHGAVQNSRRASTARSFLLARNLSSRMIYFRDLPRRPHRLCQVLDSNVIPNVVKK